MRVVELVRRHEMTNRPQPQQLVGQSAVELDRRMEEEVAVRKAHHCHSGCERKRQLCSAYGQIFEWPVDDTDVRRDGFVDVDWLVKGSAHVADHHNSGAANVGTRVRINEYRPRRRSASSWVIAF